MNLPGWRKDYPDLSMMEKIDAGNANWRWSQRHIIYLFTADENTSVRLVRLRRNALVSFLLRDTCSRIYFYRFRNHDVYS